MRVRRETRSFADRLPRLALLIGVGLALFHAALFLTWRWRQAGPRQFREILDLSSELGLMTWLTVSVTFCLGCVCLAVGRLRSSRSIGCAGVLFLFLSADDATMLHERSGWVVEQFLPDLEVYGWLIAMGPVLAVAGVLTLRGMWLLAGGSPRAGRRVLGAFALLACALALEVAEKPLHDSGLGWRGFSWSGYTKVIEELAELLAPALLLSVALQALQRELGRLRPVAADGEAEREVGPLPSLSAYRGDSESRRSA